MIGTLVRWIFVLIVCVAVVGAIGYRLDLLHRVAEEGPAQRTRMTEDQKLFHELLKAGLVTPRPDGGLDRVPQDYLLLQRITGNEDSSKEGKQRRHIQNRLLKQLDFSAVGSIVSKQLELWNQTRRVVAVRDNRPRPDGETNPLWSAFNRAERPVSPGRIVPETFGFIHGGVLQPGFTDWLSIPAAKESITFRSEISVKTAQTLKIQVIGKPIRLPRGARAQARKADLKWPCPAEPMAYVVSVPVAPSAKPRRLEIEAEPSINCSPRIHGLAIRLDRAEDGSYKTYAWRPVKRSRPSGKFAIRTADGVYLTGDNGNGKPTAATYELGLLPIIGTGGGDTFSLSGMLAGTRLPADGLEVALTIDSRMQEAAQRAIEWGIERFKNDRWAGERKSSLVVLDADTGAILAAGNHPVVPVGLHPWDYASFSATYPLRDPSTIIGWEVIDKHNTPGSTFKPVTALSLMMDENEAFRAKIRPVMQGLDSASLSRATGLSYGSSSYVAYQGAKPVPNFGGATLGRYASRPRRDRRCLPEGTKAPQPEVLFGLRRAAQFSLNAWFARVALMMEQAKIDAYAEKVENHAGERIPAPEMTLTRTSRWLGIDDVNRLDLALNVPPSAGLRRYSGEAFDVLYPQLARSTVAQMAYNKNDWGARPLIMYTIALNGIGQTISASPLHMALAASAIATGHRVRPHLLSVWDQQALSAPPRDKLPVDPDLLQLLRDGMKAVPEVGTAPRAFPRPMACRIYGKTGTAEIDAARAYNSGWFIGWREPKKPGERRLAFACMTTHATGGYRFGGTACAPVVNQMLQSLEPKEEDKDASDKSSAKKKS